MKKNFTKEGVENLISKFEKCVAFKNPYLNNLSDTQTKKIFFLRH
jgi:hypothetical protein